MTVSLERIEEQRALILYLQEEGHWSERAWLPLIRLAHRLALRRLNSNATRTEGQSDHDQSVGAAQRSDGVTAAVALRCAAQLSRLAAFSGVS
jgi:hypothetical protein